MNYDIKISTYRPLDLIGKNDHNLTLVWQFGIDCNDKQSCADVDKIVLLQIGGNKAGGSKTWPSSMHQASHTQPPTSSTAMHAATAHLNKVRPQYARPSGSPFSMPRSQLSKPLAGN